MAAIVGRPSWPRKSAASAAARPPAWLPLAQAAWDRASRDQHCAHHCGDVVLHVDDLRVASARPVVQQGHVWPLQPVVGWNDAAAALMLLLRLIDVRPPDIAEAMTSAGLPTTRAQVDSLGGKSGNKRRDVGADEWVVLSRAIVGLLKRESGQR